jgi:hypothetical protein
MRRALLAGLAGALGACSATVTSAGPAATCAVSVSPPTGGLMTTFTTTLASMNAATCTYGLDGKRTIPVECNKTFMATGAEIGDVGMHTLVVTATGPGGVGTCRATWTVLPFMQDLGAVSAADLAMGMISPPDMAAPTPDAAPPPTMLDLHDATIHNNPPNLADWPVTTTITEVDFQYQGQDGVHVEFSKRDGPGSWPDFTPPGWNGPLEYTLGMAEFINGRWHASAAIQFWRGLAASGGNVGANQQVARNWYYDGRWGEMAGYQPQQGEPIGIFVVAGNVRNITDDGSQSPVKERSNVVLVPMPGPDGASHTFQ